MFLRFVLFAGLAMVVAALMWWTMGRDWDTESPGPGVVRLSLPVEEKEPSPAAGPAFVAQSSTTLWRALDERSVNAKPPFDETWSEAGRVLVDVSEAATAARTWRVGDRVGIEIPQLGERYEASIDRIDAGPGYATAARGLATDTHGHGRRFVVTVGPGHVFAYVDTAEGPYELVGSDRLAWLLPSRSMMAGFDFNKPDYILPEAPPGILEAGRSAR